MKIVFAFLSVLCGLSSLAYAQKPMEVTVVNDSAEPILGANLMTGSVATPSFRVLTQLPLASPLRANGRSTFRFDVETQQAVEASGFRIYGTKYAIELLWGGGCKKLIEIKYDPSSQSVNAGTKQCGFHKYELIEMEKAKRDADRYFSEKEYGMAENYYSRIIKIDAKNEHALHRRGHANTYQKKFAEAVSDFTAALAVSADAAHLHGDRGNAYFGAKEYVKAAADFSRAYELAPSKTLHLRNRWTALCRSGNKASANADHQKLLEIGVPMAMTCEEWLLKQPN